tara:strand:- start:91 stop:510 length:420 start_codon:yes stop_codon:yes gene_type:complete
LETGTVLEYESLVLGDIVSERFYSVDSDTVEAYLEAIGASKPTDADNDGKDWFAPPMSVAALGLRGVIQDLSIPEGTLHVSQDLEFNKAVKVGAKLFCQAKLSQNSIRSGKRFIAVDLKIENTDRATVLTGKSTLVMPS